MERRGEKKNFHSNTMQNFFTKVKAPPQTAKALTILIYDIKLI